MAITRSRRRPPSAAVLSLRELPLELQLHVASELGERTFPRMLLLLDLLRRRCLHPFIGIVGGGSAAPRLHPVDARCARAGARLLWVRTNYGQR